MTITHSPNPQFVAPHFNIRGDHGSHDVLGYSPSRSFQSMFRREANIIVKLNLPIPARCSLHFHCDFQPVEFLSSPHDVHLVWVVYIAVF